MPYDRNNNRRGPGGSDRYDRYDRGPRTGAPKKNVPPSRQDDGPRYGRPASKSMDRFDRPGRIGKVRLDGTDAYADFSEIEQDCVERPYFLFEKAE
jgi:hypothetical protein